MEVEKLKAIAEGMGYRLRLNPDKEIVVLTGGGLWIEGNSHTYYPLTNDTQCMEIMLHLFEKAGFSFHYIDGEYMFNLARYDKKLISEKSKTINEAVCNAAYEYFKENKQ